MLFTTPVNNLARQNPRENLAHNFDFRAPFFKERRFATADRKTYAAGALVELRALRWVGGCKPPLLQHQLHIHDIEPLTFLVADLAEV